jgi:DNA (cytosine-5)-methyltransferase 1
MQEHNKLPQVLIMENVVDLVQVKFIEQWKEIQFEIEQMGYTNYTFTMNAKNYGVAQNRDRVFMVSILGKYYYEQPKPIPLEKRLKDYLELNVDDSYYLSDKLLGAFMSDGTGKYPRKERFLQNINKTNDDIANSITTLAGNRPTDNFIKTPEVKGFTELQAKMITLDGNVKRYLNSEVVDEFNVGDSADISFPNGYDKGKRTYNGIAPALNLTTTESSLITKLDNLRIRKLTPRECWRLMGIDDSYFDKASQVVSKSQLYKQAGNGIVVDVFAHILKELL